MEHQSPKYFNIKLNGTKYFIKRARPTAVIVGVISDFSSDELILQSGCVGNQCLLVLNCLKSTMTSSVQGWDSLQVDKELVSIHLQAHTNEQ